MPRRRALGWLIPCAALAAPAVWAAVSGASADWNGLTDSATVITAVWVLLRHYCGGRRLSDKEWVLMNQTLARGIAEGLSTPGTGEAGERRPQPVPPAGPGSRSAR